MTIPWDLMLEILHRLPVKSLLRFRSVSKQFCSEIDSPKFIQLHHAQSLKNNTNLSIVVVPFNHMQRDHESFFSLNFDPCEEPSLLQDRLTIFFPKPNWPDTALAILGSCNGLLCLTDYLMTSFFVLNMATRKHYFLPCCKITSRMKMGPAGFGYDPCNDEYTVVKIWCVLDEALRWEVKVMVYSSKSREWKKSREKFLYPWIYYNQKGIMACGRMNFVARNSYQRRDTSIVGFDLGTESFKEVPLPCSLVGTQDRWTLAALEGDLCTVQLCSDTKCTNVWVMKEYGVQESWTKMLAFHLPITQDAIGAPILLHPLAYSATRDEFLLRVCSTLIWYNLNTKQMRTVRVQNMPNTFQDFETNVVVETLFPVPEG